MPVATGVIGIANRVASIALLHVPAQCVGSAGDDGAPGFGLGGTQGVLGKIGLPMRLENIGQCDAAPGGHALWRGRHCLGQQLQW